MIYAYKCRTCGSRVDSEIRADTIGLCTTELSNTLTREAARCPGELRRLFIVRTEAMVHGHYNASLNQYVSGDRDFDEKLKRESERVSMYQGTEARFERVDPTDKAALGVTDQGMDDSNRIRSKQGLPTFKV